MILQKKEKPSSKSVMAKSCPVYWPHNKGIINLNFRTQEVVILPGFFEQYIGFAIAALFFVIAVSAVLFLYYFLAKRRFGGTVKVGSQADTDKTRD